MNQTKSNFLKVYQSQNFQPTKSHSLVHLQQKPQAVATGLPNSRQGPRKLISTSVQLQLQGQHAYKAQTEQGPYEHQDMM
jgi:hypothetical protein